MDAGYSDYSVWQLCHLSSPVLATWCGCRIALGFGPLQTTRRGEARAHYAPFERSDNPRHDAGKRGQSYLKLASLNLSDEVPGDARPCGSSCGSFQCIAR